MSTGPMQKWHLFEVCIAPQLNQDYSSVNMLDGDMALTMKNRSVSSLLQEHTPNKEKKTPDLNILYSVREFDKDLPPASANVFQIPLETDVCYRRGVLFGARIPTGYSLARTGPPPPQVCCKTRSFPPQPPSTPKKTNTIVFHVISG